MADLEPREADDYSAPQVEAARRVIIDVMQVLASYHDCLVLVGGWVPDLLLPDAEEAHVGSIDVDLALDAAKLGDGRYAEMLKLLLGTRRYRMGEKSFQLVADIDLGDGHPSLSVDVEFLAPKEAKTRGSRPAVLKGFRVLQADGCESAFRSPVTIELEGEMIKGAANVVDIRIVSVPDFLVMKAYAIQGRDKPKDVYDFCYCLDHTPGGPSELGINWKTRAPHEPDVAKAIKILRNKFQSPEDFGPTQVVEFHNDPNQEVRDQQARRAYELMRVFLENVTDSPA